MGQELRMGQECHWMLRCAWLWDSQAELNHTLGAAKPKESLLKAKSHTRIDSRQIEMCLPYS